MAKTHNYFFPISNVPWQTTHLEQITRNGKIAALDIDDTLADFVPYMESIYGTPHHPQYNGYWRLEEMWPDVDWETELKNVDHAYKMPSREGAHELADELARKVPFIYLTARPPELNYATATWLHHNEFIPAPIACVGKDLKKGLLRSGLFGVIIDDSPTAMKIARDVKALRFCIKQPWNEDEQRRFSLQEVTRELRGM